MPRTEVKQRIRLKIAQKTLQTLIEMYGPKNMHLLHRLPGDSELVGWQLVAREAVRVTDFLLQELENEND